MNSIWQKTAHLPRFSRLSGEKSTDVLIIGGGISGLLLAHELSLRGVNYILVEKDKICSATTANTTAKITSQHGAIYHKLLSRLGEEKAALYLKANEDAISAYRSLAKKIDCDFEETNAFVYAREDTSILEKELRALEKIGYSPIISEGSSLPFEVAMTLGFSNQAHFNPLKFLGALAAELNIYEHTRINELGEGIAKTDLGTIRAEKIVVATHFPFLNKHGLYFTKMYQSRSYVLALENAPKLDGMYIDCEENGLSFRNYDKYLLFGGCGHRTGEHHGGYTRLEWYREKYYPDARIFTRYATEDPITLDDIPYIGRYSRSTCDLYVTTGFNKWGMTSAMVSARILSDLLTDRKNDLAELYSPSRSMLTPRLFSNLGKTALNLIRPTTPRCTHLGCALKYNTEEHTWDCSCHGSRYTADGRVIDGPATKNLK